MKNSSSALQQATRPAGFKTQDQATQTTFEIPRPFKSSNDSDDFLKKEVLRIPSIPQSWNNLWSSQLLDYLRVGWEGFSELETMNYR